MYINGRKDRLCKRDSAEHLSHVTAKIDLTGVEASYNTTSNKIDFKSTNYGSSATVNVTTVLCSLSRHI